MFNCSQTPSNADGQYFAGVGKHALKFVYEFDLIEAVKAPAKTFCNAIPRSPGADATGAGGGGEGEAARREAILIESDNLAIAPPTSRYKRPVV